MFSNNLVNFHGTRLPLDAGGGGFSWRIMRGDRIASFLVHLIDAGIDTGDVLFAQRKIFPSSCVKPIDFQAFYSRHLVLFFRDFLGALIAGNKFTRNAQSQGIGSYFPRLNTDVHGYIDWAMQPNDIVRFIVAFDDPYSGASTFLKNEKVRLKNVHLHRGEVACHPFMSGLVLRHDGEWLVVSLGNEYCLLVETVISENDENILNEVKVGDRFHTPRTFLENAMAYRETLGPS